jgi:hypothetical protein
LPCERSTRQETLIRLLRREPSPCDSNSVGTRKKKGGSTEQDPPSVWS